MIIAAALSERWSGAIFYKKKQREEDKRMKKKVLAFLLASTMVIEPFTVASAADFSDGMGHEDVQFNDDAEDVPEIENNVNGVDQFRLHLMILRVLRLFLVKVICGIIMRMVKIFQIHIRILLSVKVELRRLL